MLRRATRNSRRALTAPAVTEALEDRALLTNFAVTGASLVDGTGTPMASAVLGERMSVQVDYTTEDISLTDYTIEFKVDGVVIDTVTNQGTDTGNDGSYTAEVNGWYASAGSHLIEIFVDADDDVVEDDETDNMAAFTVSTSVASPAFQLAWPVEGVIQQDSFIGNYVDVDPTATHSDLFGGIYTYDGHTAWDISVPHTEDQDAGIDIYAAAAGTVVSINDGEFDRQTGFITPAPAANFVVVDHGDGYQTTYWHLRRDSVQVNVGDTVAQGDKLGLMGSSGFSTGTHLHFGLRRHGLAVEPMFDPGTYLQDVPAYSSTIVSQRSSRITSYSLVNDIKEGPARVSLFKRANGIDITAYGSFTSLKQNDVLEFVWYRPNGTEFTRAPVTLGQDYQTYFQWFRRTLEDNPARGVWTVEFLLNGAKLGEDQFEIQNTGAAEMLVTDDTDTIIVNNRYTPIDFGTADVAATAPEVSVFVENHGTEDLDITAVRVPTGFNITQALPGTLAPNAVAEMIVELDTTFSGNYAGEIFIESNDFDTPRYRFSVQGQVETPGTPNLVLGIGERTITEGDNVIANVRRVGDSNAVAQVVTLTVDDATQLSFPPTVTIPAGSDYVNFVITAVDDPTVDGDMILEVVASAAGYSTGLNTLEVLDNDVAGFQIIETDGDTVVDESGTIDTFDVVLTTQPLNDVIIDLTASDATEASLLPTSITFTNTDWDTPQTITVTGEDDIDLDGPIGSLITVATTNASDMAFRGLTTDVAVLTTDDDIAAIQISQSGGATVVDESGTTDSFDLILASRPLTNVVIEVISNDTGEATVSPSLITFTPLDWDTLQTVDVTGVDDVTLDGDQTTDLTIRVVNADSFDGYDDTETLVVATTLDNDSPGIGLIPTNGATIVNESGTTDFFDVVLDVQPLTDVVVSVVSTDSGEATISPGLLTFTPADWNIGQVVTVFGTDDTVADGDQTLSIIASVVPTGSDPGFHGTSTSIGVTNEDDDAVVIVDPSGGTTEVNESGTTDTVAISLKAVPLADVVVELISGDGGEVSAPSGRLTFTPANWGLPQTATLTGVDDDLVDGTQNSFVLVRVVESESAAAFMGVTTTTLTTTFDNEVAGIVVTPTDGTTSVGENGTGDTVDLTLTARPLSTVVVEVTSGDVGEVITPPLRYTFTPTTWNTPQSVTVLGVDDVTLDGPQITTMSVSVVNSLSQNLFDDVVQPFDVITVDDETATWTVEESDGSNQVSEDGLTDTFTVILNAQPTSNVTVEMVTTSPDEVSASPGTLTFTPTNWNILRTVTISGVDDSAVDGAQTVPLTLRTIDAETNDAFDGLEQTLSVVNADNDVAGIVLTPSAGTTVVTEGSTTDSIGVTLNAMPLDDVVVNVLSSDTTQATVDLSALTFTSTNWNTPQSVEVTAFDDVLADGDTTIQVAVSVVDAESHAQFHGLSEVTDVLAIDDDPGVTVTETGVGTTVDETGTTDTFDVVLDAEPLGPVVLSAVSRNNGEVNAAPTFLTFTTTNWSTPQTVAVTGVDDVLLDGTQLTAVDVAVVDIESADAYDGLVQAVTVATTDDDLAEIVIVESGGSTIVSELLTTDSVNVSLASRPLTTVVLDVASLDTGEVTASPASLTFTPSGWSTPQTVTLTGVDDAPVDGDQITSVVVSVDDAQSAAAFAGVQNTVQVTTLDNEVAAFSVFQSDGTTEVSESGTTDDFSVVLDASPTNMVVLEITSIDPGEVTVGTSTLTFTPADWNVAQSVTVTGQDDVTVDGPRVSLIQIRVDDALSDDAFDGLVDSTIQAVNADDDVAGFSILESQCSTVVHETGTSDTFMVQLDRQPLTGIVFFTHTDHGDELSVSPAELTFTSANWNVPQEITVTGLDDSDADTNGPFSVLVSVEPTRSDNAFDSLDPRAILVTNISDEASLGAQDDSVTVTRDTPRTIDVVSNDIPTPGARVASVGPVANGSVQHLANGSLRFTPEAGFVGVTSFDYSIVGAPGKLLGDEALQGDEFGHALAIDGNLAVVGVPRAGSSQVATGVAYVYEQRNDGGWSKIAKVVPADAEKNDAFGYAVALDGDTLVVSARMDDDQGRNSGSVYVFERNLGGVNNFGLVTKLTDANGAEKDQFGHSVAVEGDTILVGARMDDDLGRNSGSAFVFDRDGGGVWNLTSQLLPTTLLKGDQFGYDVAVEGDLFLVGARKSNEQKTDAGSAYLFERNLGGPDTFGIVTQFTAADAKQFDWFGHSVDINNDTVVIGKPIRNGRQRTGEAYIFGRDQGGADNWGQVTQVAAPDAAVANQFGYSVALSDTTLYAGARLDHNVNQNGGRVYAFGAGSGWDLTRTVNSTDSANGDYFGQAVAASNNAVFIAAPRDDDNGGRSGSVFTEDLTSDTATVTVTVTAPLLATTTGQGSHEALSIEAVAEAVETSVDQWIAAGITPEQTALLRSVQLSVVDLPGTQIGGAVGTSILLDVNAAGHGWSFDGRSGYDLNTVVAHELGHILGHDDLYSPADHNDIMFGYLEAGQQKTVADAGIDNFFRELKSDEALFTL